MSEARVLFKTVRFKNFMATGAAFTEIALNANERNLLIGKNGSGKSQMIDAVCFALYNKAFRAINKPDLINAINEKDSVVELEFEVLGIQYKVVRAQKNNIFEVYKDGEFLNKTGVDDLQGYLEKQVVKMNFKTFCQVVVLGSTNYVPFMQLPAGHRREVIESLLDLQTFSIMNTLLKGKVSELTKEIDALQRDETRLDSTCALYRQQLSKLNQDNEGYIMDLMIQIGELEGAIEDRKRQNEVLEAEIDQMLKDASDVQELERKLSEYMNIKGSLHQKKNHARQTLTFFETNETCPVCAQDIQHDHKQMMVSDHTNTIGEMSMGLEKVDNLIRKTQEQINRARLIENNINRNRSYVRQNNDIIAQHQAQRSQREAQINKLKQPTTALASAQDELVAAEAQLTLVKDQLAVKKAQMDHHAVKQDLLKDDGIKATILSKYIPVINAQVNAYLGAMNFFVGFEMNEVFDVTFKSRFRDKFKYEMFSEGQKARIDLALMMTWRDVARLKNSVSTNLLVMDEVFDGSLDTEGTEELMNIFNALAGENVWVISHKDLYVEKFDKVYRFVLQDNFSQMVEVK